MQPGFWRKCRVCGRWLRRGLLLAVVALICVFIWFDRVGVPDFLKQRLAGELRARGIELNFVRLRLSPVRGLIAQNVSVGKTATSGSPAFSAREIRLEINFIALLHRRLQLDGLDVNDGKFTLPLSPTNIFTLNNIQTNLRFGTNDTWSLDNFKADFEGAKLAFSGDIVHAPEIQNWAVLHRNANTSSVSLAQLQQFADAIRQIHFAGLPQLNLNISGDARNIHSFDVRLVINAPGVQTPWVGANAIQLTAKLTAPADAPTNADSALAWWTNLQPYQITWTLRLARLKSTPLNADSFVCDGFWRAPDLTLTNLSAGLGGGTLEARAHLNVATRELTFTDNSHFDLHAITALLTDKTRERLADFSWTQPPYLRAAGTLVLPAWADRKPDWRDEVQPTIRLNGQFAFTNATVHGVAVDSIAAGFSYSNLVWQIPALSLAQSDTLLEMSGHEDDTTKNYDWHIHGTLDPESLRPFLDQSDAERAFHHFTITEPVHLDADIRGRLYDYDSLGVNGHMALTNFNVHGEAMDSVAGDVSYTNRILAFSNARLWRGAETMTADKITLDFNTHLIWFTNGYSTAEPAVVANAIGPKTGKLLEPYHFLQPPTVFVEGCIPLRDMNGIDDLVGTDIRFDIVAGAPFQCLKFRSKNVTGTIHWLGKTLILTNIAAEVYGGGGTGWACFDFSVPHEGADYQFIANVTNVNLHALALDLSSPTNHLEGKLSGRVIITHADTRDWRSVDGYGRANLHDGLLWDIPVIGIISPMLNTVSPGLGDSRATDAAGKFFITNGVIYSDSLEIHSTMIRLSYSGAVDLKQNVNAGVTGELLRDTPVIGQMVSTIFYPLTKLFEFKITGTLDDPKKEPVFFPNFLLTPLHPFHSLGGLFSGYTMTNAPPEK